MGTIAKTVFGLVLSYSIRLLDDVFRLFDIFILRPFFSIGS